MKWVDLNMSIVDGVEGGFPSAPPSSMTDEAY